MNHISKNRYLTAYSNFRHYTQMEKSFMKIWKIIWSNKKGNFFRVHVDLKLINNIYLFQSQLGFLPRNDACWQEPMQCCLQTSPTHFSRPTHGLPQTLSHTHTTWGPNKTPRALYEDHTRRHVHYMRTTQDATCPMWRIARASSNRLQSLHRLWLNVMCL